MRSNVGDNVVSGVGAGATTKSDGFDQSAGVPAASMARTQTRYRPIAMSMLNRWVAATVDWWRYGASFVVRLVTQTS